MLNGRRRSSAAITAVLLALVIGSVPSSPAQAEPSIDEVQTRVDRLYHQAEQAQERYHDAKVELDELRKDVGSLQADQDRQDDRLTTVREQVQDSIVSQYEGTSLSAVGQAVVSEDPSQFLSQLTTIAAYNDIQSQLFADYSTELKALDIRSAATNDRRARMAALEKELAKEQAAVQDKLAEAKDQLGQLKEDEREELLASRSGSVRLPTDVPASGRAGAAVQYALAQVGDAYVYGAAGPERLRLLGPDDDGLGAGGRRPAALLERAVRSRTAHLLQRPAAGRPGLLLQPDQPRRHVHRQRPDRARRQPRRRRPGGRSVLDAVLRRGPPWLIPARTPM